MMHNNDDDNDRQTNRKDPETPASFPLFSSSISPFDVFMTCKQEFTLRAIHGHEDPLRRKEFRRICRDAADVGFTRMTHILMRTFSQTWYSQAAVLGKPLTCT